MAGLIQKSGYIKPGSGGAGSYMKYIATRDGVELRSGDGPASQKQQQLIADLLRDFPDTVSLDEYDDYKTAPTAASASAFISAALDENAHALQESDRYMRYIATRPRAEKHGEHGLFSSRPEVSLEDSMKEVSEHQREDGRWEGRIVVGHKENGEPIFHYISAKTQKALLEKLHRSMEEYDGAELTEQSRITLGEWLDIWLEECAALSVRPSTLKGYRGYVEKNIKPCLGDKQICKVTTADVQSLYRKLQKEGGASGGPLAGTSVRRIHNVLHQALDVAVNRHLIVKNPSNDVTLPKKESTVKTILNDAQLERFMDAIKADEHWHDFFYLEITTGLRRGELCGLMWSDFDEKKGTLSIRRTLHAKEGGGYYAGDTKTGTGRRTIKLPPSTVQLLSERKKKSVSQWLFPNPIHPEDPIMPNSGYERMKKLMADAGLPNIRFHDLRHTFATHALTSGVDAKTLSSILGHTKTSFTLDTYTHVTGDMHQRASEIVGSFMEDFMVKG